jgi:hypothetical protein
MAEMSDFFENEVIDVLLRNQAKTMGNSMFVALTTAVITDANTGATITEVANANGYARQAVTFTAASGGATANNADVVFGPNTTSDWGTVTSIAIVDSTTHGAGNLIMYDNDMADVAMAVDDTLTFATGDIDVTFD